MIVLDKLTMKPIGDLNIPYDSGSRVLQVATYDLHQEDLDDMTNTTALVMPSTMLLTVEQGKLVVLIDEFEIINDKMRFGHDRDLRLLACKRYPEFERFAEQPGAVVQVSQMPLNMAVEVSVRFPCIKADIDLSEKLFDMDQFTPL